MGDLAMLVVARLPRAATAEPGQPAPVPLDADGDGMFDSFGGIIPGAELVYEVIAYNDLIPAAGSDQAFVFTLQLASDEGMLLDTRQVVMLVPHE